MSILNELLLLSVAVAGAAVLIAGALWALPLAWRGLERNTRTISGACRRNHHSLGGGNGCFVVWLTRLFRELRLPALNNSSPSRAISCGGASPSRAISCEGARQGPARNILECFF
jgi:hypothetical protein